MNRAQGYQAGGRPMVRETGRKPALHPPSPVDLSLEVHHHDGLHLLHVRLERIWSEAYFPICQRRVAESERG